MIRRPPRSTRTYTLLPYTTLFRSAADFNTSRTVRQTQGGVVYERDMGGGNSLRAMVYYGQRDTVQYQAIPVVPQLAPSHPGGVIDLARDYGGADLLWPRSEERRVGDECCRTCRSWGDALH